MSTFSSSNKEPLVLSNEQLDHLVNVANKAMDTAGEIILRHYDNVVKASSNNTNWKSIATEAETAMISVILSSGRHTVYAKQSGWNNCSSGDPEFVWVIDPINGTTDGLLPTFGTSIALLHNGIPVIGCINNPIARIKTIGRRNGIGITTRNGQRARTRACEDLGQAYIDIKEPDYNKDAKAAYGQLEYRVAEIFLNGTCISYSELAAGMLQAILHTAVDPCGFLALVPIVEGAGGVITDWQGNPLSWQPSPTASIPHDGFNVVASADPTTHQHILSAIS